MGRKRKEGVEGLAAGAVAAQKKKARQDTYRLRLKHSGGIIRKLIQFLVVLIIVLKRGWRAERQKKDEEIAHLRAKMREMEDGTFSTWMKQQLANKKRCHRLIRLFPEEFED